MDRVTARAGATCKPTRARPLRCVRDVRVRVGGVAERKPSKISDEPPGVIPRRRTEDREVGLRAGRFRRVRTRGAATAVQDPATGAPARAASPDDPLRVFLANDLFAGSGGTINGGEVSQAKAGNVVVQTGNWFAAYSVDGGRTFRFLNPYSDLNDPQTGAPLVDAGFCCDQRVIYAPGANLFVWVRQTASAANGENRYRMGVSTPERLIASRGTDWTSYDIVPRDFGVTRNSMDYPDLSASLRYLYITFNLTDGAIMARYPLGPLSRGERSVRPRFYFPRFQWLTPAQNITDRAYFAQHVSTSRLRNYVWLERPIVLPLIGPIDLAAFDVDVSSIPQSNFTSNLPNGGRDWLAGSKIGTDVVTGTVARGQVWWAWSAARGNGFPRPHIELAKVSARTLSLLSQDYIWNREHDFVYPDIATNSQGEVGISFAWGSGRHYVHTGVGFLTGREALVNTSPDGQASGAHYNEIQPSWPDTRLFTAGNFFGAPATAQQYANHPQFIVFGRSSESGPSPPPPPPPPGASSLTLACPAEATAGRPTTVSGTLTPATPNASIRVTWTNGSFSTDRMTTTDADGNYSDTYSPSPGRWTVRARFAGSAQLAPSESAACTIASEEAPP